MQMTSRFSFCLKLAAALPLLFVFGLFFLAPIPVKAATQNTAFIPFKINAPDTTETARQADELLQQALERKSLKMMPREEAIQLVDYRGTWPPVAETLTKISEQTGFDYVAVGSLTMIGDQVSIDVQVFDVLAPESPHSSYRDGLAVTGLDAAITETITDILSFTSRNYIIATIAPEGNERIDSGAILRKITTKPGDFYDPARLRQDLKNVFSMGYFDNVEIESTDTDKGKAIVFRVMEKPVIATVLISGTDEIDEQEVRDAASIVPNTILNPTRLNDAVQRINELYKSKGYYNTKTTVDMSFTSEDRVEVRFTVNEGPKIYIGKILFEGNKAFDDDDLEDVIETSERNWLSWITESGVLKMNILQQDAAKIGAFYHNHGFIEAKIGEPTVEQKDDELQITFHIQEGPRYRVGTVDIEGDLIEDKEKLISMLKIRDEKYLNRQILRNDNMKLTDLYAEHGYAFAEIRPKINTSPDSKRVDIVLLADKGPLVYFNRVEIQGNTRTRDNVIRRDLVVEEGGIFDSTAIRKSTEKLQRLGFFEEVSVTPQPTMKEDQMDVLVNIKEQSTGQFSIGGGYSSSDSLMFMAEISENNIFGTGNRLALSANLSSITTRFNLSFTNPRIFDSHVLAGIDLFNWEKEYDDYTKDSIGGGLRFGHRLFEKWRISYGYSYSDTNLSDVAEDASYVIRESQNINVTSALHLGFSRDTRNHFFSPSSGSVNSLTFEYAGGFLGGDAEFQKVEALTSWYFPLPWDSVFHVKGSAGQVFADDKSKLPVYEHFYLGGLNSIRGFQTSYVSPRDPITDERIGGDKMWFANVEIIFPLFEEMGLRGVVFTDVGNVYATWEEWEFDDIRSAVGFGFNWMSPMGPLRLAWGYNLDPRYDEDESVWDFSIGGGF